LCSRNFRAFDSGDLRTLEETTAPGFVDHNPLEGELPGVKGTTVIVDIPNNLT